MLYYSRRLNCDPFPWLMQGEPWVKYRALIDLEDRCLEDPEVRRARKSILEHPVIMALVEDLHARGPISNSIMDCYRPEEPIWKLWYLADMGLTWKDIGLQEDFWTSIFDLQVGEDAGFKFSPNDHRSFTCLSANTLYILFRLGFMGHAGLDRSYHHLLLTQGSDGGWHCDNRLDEDGELRDKESCPFATLNVLQAFSIHPFIRYTEHPKGGVEVLLNHWERRQEPYRPDGWGIGSQWHKLIYPYVNYSILKFVDVLSHYRAAHQDPRFHQVLEVLLRKQDDLGRFPSEAVYQGLQGLDIGGEGEPSRWITLAVTRALKRIPLP